MKKNDDLTLENIGRLIDEKLDVKLVRNNVLIFADINNAVERLENKIDNLHKEMNQRFDVVGDQLQDVI